MKKALGAIVLGSALALGGCSGSANSAPTQPESPTVISIPPVYGNDFHADITISHVLPKPGTIEPAYGNEVNIGFAVNVQTNKEKWAAACGLERDDGEVYLMQANELQMTNGQREFKSDMWYCIYWMWDKHVDDEYEFSRGHEVSPFIAFGDMGMSLNKFGYPQQGINREHVQQVIDFNATYKVE